MNKRQLKTIAISIATAIIGLVIGYFIFSEEGNHSANESKNHQHAADEQIWTCSMHPQIRKNEPGDCPICGMDLIPLADKANDNPLILEMTEDAIQLANIQTNAHWR